MGLINEEAFNNRIKEEVEKALKTKLDEFKKELSKNYYFDDCLWNKVKVSKKLNISVRQVDNLVTSGKLIKSGLGRSVKFRKSEVIEYMKSLK